MPRRVDLQDLRQEKSLHSISYSQPWIMNAKESDIVHGAIKSHSSTSIDVCCFSYVCSDTSTIDCIVLISREKHLMGDHPLAESIQENVRHRRHVVALPQARESVQFVPLPLNQHDIPRIVLIILNYFIYVE